jgi:ribosomal-protein-serine acetyltransferase
MAPTPDIFIPVNDQLSLRAIDERFVPELHQLVLKNQAWLQHSLNWAKDVTDESASRQNAQGNVMLHQRGYAKMFLIFDGEEMVGVLSFNQIEPLNKTGYIGYWLDESHQGKGILSQALQAFMQFYSQRGDVRRFVIKCRVANEPSNRVAQRNGFALEGCLKQAEFLNGDYHDQNIYARIIDPSSA